MKVKDSPLYKALRKAVRKEDHAELLRMLEMVAWSSLHAVRWDGLHGVKLRLAFCWRDSLQGFDYWLQLSRRLKLAGWECW